MDETIQPELWKCSLGADCHKIIFQNYMIIPINIQDVYNEIEFYMKEIPFFSISKYSKQTNTFESGIK